MNNDEYQVDYLSNKFLSLSFEEKNIFFANIMNEMELEYVVENINEGLKLINKPYFKVDNIWSDDKALEQIKTEMSETKNKNIKKQRG